MLKMLMGRNKIIKPNKDISSTLVLFKEKSQKCIFSFVSFTTNTDSFALSAANFIKQWFSVSASFACATPVQILCVGETGL